MLFLLIVALFHRYASTAQTPCAMLSTKGTHSLRIMSYNIRYDEPKDGINQWLFRKDDVVNLIRNRTPDIIGFQEPASGQMSDLYYALPNYNYYGVSSIDGKTKGEFAPIFYRSDRFDLLDNGTFWLSETPTEPGSIGWDARVARVCSWVQLYDRETLQTFYHFNTHFDSKGKLARSESARLILSQTEAIAGQSTPIILSGDFNASPSSDAYRILTTNSHLQDSKYLSNRRHCGPHSTFSTFFVGKTMGDCVDHMFVTPKDFNILHYATLTDSNNGLYPSDHFPLLIEITFKTTSSAD